MRLPHQAPAVERFPFGSPAAPASAVTASAGTCECTGAPAGCNTKTDNCGTGFYAVCSSNIYGCGCSCSPVTA